MGLDLALGGLVLISAIRGWLKGFLVQAIRLAGLVASAYAALPVRDQAKPYVMGYLPTIRPDLVDRLLWWSSAVVSYFVLVGVASLLLAVSRKKTFGLDETQRGDQFAGFGLGAIKGLILASFLVAGLQTYGPPYLDKLPWADGQTRESYAWEWGRQYRPASRIWNAPPVQQFVHHVQTMGLQKPGDKRTPSMVKSGDGAEVEAEPPKSAQTTSRVPKLTVPAARRNGPSRSYLELDTTGLDPELAHAVDSIRTQLEKLP